MKNNIDKDSEMVKGTMNKLLVQRYKRPKWEQFKDFVGIVFLGLFALIFIGLILVLGITLIENPISLAILCGTILLVIIWSQR